MSYYVTNIKLHAIDGKTKTVPFYYSTNSQDVLFQIKYYDMCGLHLVSPEFLRIFLGGQSLEEMEMSQLTNVSSWKRSINTFKKQLPNCMLIKNDLDFRIFKPDISNLTKHSKFLIELKKLLECFVNFSGKNYYYGILYENGFIDEPDQNRAKYHYEHGVEAEGDHFCAAKMMLYHIEPMLLNKEIPDYNCKLGLFQMIETILKTGIFEIYTPEKRKMDLLYLFYIQMDLSTIMREEVVKICQEIEVEFENIVPSDVELVEKITKEFLIKQTIYILCQPNKRSQHYKQAIELFERLALIKQFEYLNLFLGDLYDCDFYGFKDITTLEKRMEYYSRSRNIERIVAGYLIFFEHFDDLQSRTIIETKIYELYQKKETFSVNDIYLIREISMKGGTNKLTDFFNIKKDELLDIYEFKANKEYLDLYQDLILGINKLDPNGKIAQGRILFEEKKQWIESLLIKKRINVTEFLKSQELLIMLGRFKHLNSQFFIYKSLGDIRSKRCALRIKTLYDDYEPFHLLLYYFSTKFKRSLTKTSIGLKDCLIMTIEQLKWAQYMNERQGGRMNEEYDPHEIYMQSKGKNFSCFFSNNLLYYKIFKFLKYNNMSELSEIFLKAAEIDTFSEIENFGDDESDRISIRDLITMNKIIEASNGEKELRNRLQGYLLLQLARSDTDKVFLFLSLLKLSSDDETLENLMKIADFAVQSSTRLSNSYSYQRELSQYLIGIVERRVTGSFTEHSTAFKEYLDKFWSGQDIPKLKLPLVYGTKYPQNDLGCMVSISNQSACDRYYDEFLIPLIKNHIEYCKTTNIGRKLDFNDIGVLRSLTNDFDEETQKINDHNLGINKKLLNDSQELSDDEDHENKGKNMTNKFNITTEIESTSITENQMYNFEMLAKSFPSIRIFNSVELLITENYDKKDYFTYLKLEGISIMHGYIVQNQQRFSAFRVIVKKKEHLAQISSNYELLSIFSPLCLNYLGIMYEMDYEKHIIQIDFITSPLMFTMKDYFNRMRNIKSKVLYDYQIEFSMKLTYVIDSLIRCGIPPSQISPELIFVSKKENPQILIPFFSPRYFCYTLYYDALIRRQGGLTLEFSYIPPFYEEFGDEDFDIIEEMGKKNNYSVGSIPKMGKNWANILKMTYYSLALTLIETFTMSPIFPEKKFTEDKTEFMVDLRNPKQFSKYSVLLLKKFRKVMRHREISNDIIKMFDGVYQETDLSAFLHAICKETSLPKHPFNTMTYLEDIILSNEILVFGGDTAGRSFIRRLIYLSNCLVYNGFFDSNQSETSKFYYKNNLTMTIDQNKENSSFKCNVFVDDSRTIIIEFKLNDVKEALLTIKGTKLGLETRISLSSIYDNSAVVQAEFWKRLIENFKEQSTSIFETNYSKSKLKLSLATVSSFSHKTRTKKSVDLLTNVIYNYMDLFEHQNLNKEILFYDVFGNIIYRNPALIKGTSFYENEYAFRTICPLNFTSTYFVCPQSTKYMYLWTDMTHISLKKAPASIDSYQQMIRTISEDYKEFSMITFFDNHQFWGNARGAGMIEGNFYSNFSDYSTISNRKIFKGRFSSHHKDMVYEGFFQGGLPHFFGTFSLGNRKVYTGFLNKGCPDGKGVVFYPDGSLLFSGLFSGGFPARGIFYALPFIYEGTFDIGSKSSYKFSFKRQNLLAKSLDYPKMMQKFTVDGSLFNFERSVKVVKGIIQSNSSVFSGVFRIRSNEETLYHGILKESQKSGPGIMVRPDGMKMVGTWSQKIFQGKVVLTQKLPLRDKVPILEEGQMHAYHDYIKAIQFNACPIEVKGKFKIRAGKLRIYNVGEVYFDDGSVYKGMMKNNAIHGFGRMIYSFGGVYEGTWFGNEHEGFGKFSSHEFEYKGQFKKGIWHGFGSVNVSSELLKGHWKSGILQYAFFDKFDEENKDLVKERVVFGVSTSPDLKNMSKYKINGPCEVTFSERHSDTISRIGNAGNSTIQAANISYRSNSSVKKINAGSVTPTMSSPYKKLMFIGEFLVLKNDYEDYKSGQTIGFGSLIQGQNVLFRGVANMQFSRLIGTKFIYETEEEEVGTFDEKMNLQGLGSVSNGVSSFQGNFVDGRLNGLGVQLNQQQIASIGYYEQGFREGLALFFGKRRNDLRRYKSGEIAVYYNNSNDH